MANKDDDGADALVVAGNDMIRASNTMMLMLAGELSLAKMGVESAIRRALDARNAWDNAVAAKATRPDGEGKKQ